MRMPKAFIAELAATVGSVVLIALSALSYFLTKESWLTLSLLLLGLLALGAALVIHSLRSERQNQRINKQLKRGRNSSNQVLLSRNGGIDGDLSQINQRLVGIASQLSSLRLSGLGSDSNGSAEVPKQVSASADELLEQSKVVGPSRVVEEGVTSVGRGKEKRNLLVRLATESPAEYVLQARDLPVSLEIPVDRATGLNIKLRVSNSNRQGNSKVALVSVKALDVFGKELDFALAESRSEKFGYFKYLKTTGGFTSNTLTFSAPLNATKLVLQIHPWEGSCELINEIQLELSQEPFSKLNERKSTDIRVASILDEFSFNCFRYECNLLSLNPRGWKEQMEEFKPDLFLCESAWAGNDPVTHPWKGKIYTSSRFNHENRIALLDILHYCNENGIPTVFWNKEDPSHYDDKIHNFVDTAIKFDHIFTTDSSSCERYRIEYNHPSVDVLQFAVQPRLFNPMNSGSRAHAVEFAGSWYKNHTNRCLAMERMFDAVLESDYELVIYDRFKNSGDSNHDFPEKYLPYVRGSVPNTEMPEVYKSTEIGMTINTEVKSPTMFARRIYELAACNTLIVSNNSVGVKQTFGDNVVYLEDDPNALRNLTPEKVKEATENNLKLVLSEHTYYHRFTQILDKVGIAYDDDRDRVSIVAICSNSENARKAWKELQATGHTFSSKYILLTGDVTPLNYSVLFSELNKGGTMVAYLPSLLSGETDLKESFDADAYALVVNYGSYGEVNLTDIGLNKLITHASYSDFPVMDSAVSNKESGAYTTAEIDEIQHALTKSDKLPRILSSWDSSANQLVYLV